MAAALRLLTNSQLPVVEAAVYTLRQLTATTGGAATLRAPGASTQLHEATRALLTSCGRGGGADGVGRGAGQRAGEAARGARGRLAARVVQTDVRQKTSARSEGRLDFVHVSRLLQLVILYFTGRRRLHLRRRLRRRRIPRLHCIRALLCTGRLGGSRCGITYDAAGL